MEGGGEREIIYLSLSLHWWGEGDYISIATLSPPECFLH